MSLVSNVHFGKFSKQGDIKVSGEKFVANELDKTVADRVDGLVMYEVINRKFSLRKLLIGVGYYPDGQNMYCPFHNDKLTGKPSAKYHPDTDKLYCFSESKIYTAYHALKLLYNKDMRSLFSGIWKSMSPSEKREVKDKCGIVDNIDEESSVWEEYSNLLSEFKNQRITYSQMKNGIYRVMLLDSSEENNEEQEVD